MINKYITITEGEDYRTIANKMTNLGHKMNHATARNILLCSMKKIIKNISEELGHNLDESEATDLILRQDIHEIIGDILTLSLTEENIRCQQANQTLLQS